MTFLVWLGLAMAVFGVVLIGWCILRAVAIRRGDLSEDAIAGGIRRILLYNTVAVGIAFFGLAFMLLGLLI